MGSWADVSQLGLNHHPVYVHHDIRLALSVVRELAVAYCQQRQQQIHDCMNTPHVPKPYGKPYGLPSRVHTVIVGNIPAGSAWLCNMGCCSGLVSLAASMNPATLVSDAFTTAPVNVHLPAGAPSRFVVAATAANAQRKLRDYTVAMQSNPAIFVYFGLLYMFTTVPMVTIRFMLKDEFHMSPSFMTGWSQIIGAPWGLKIVYAYISDNYALFRGYKRLPLAVVGSLVSGVAWLMLCVQIMSGDRSVWILTVIMLLLSASAAVGECGVNGALMDYVEQMRGRVMLRTSSQDEADKMADCIFSAQGTVMSASLVVGLAMGLWASVDWNPVVTFAFTGIGFLGLAVVCANIKEDRAWHQSASQGNAHGASLIQSVKLILKAPYMKSLLVFFAATVLPPDSGSAMFFFLTERLHFGPGILSLVSIVTAAAGSFGSFFYYAFLRDVNFHLLFSTVFLICTPLGLAQILLVNGFTRSVGIPDKFFLIGDDTIRAAVGRIIRTPINSMMSSICPKHMKATSFELLNSVANICGIISGAFSSWLMVHLHIDQTNFDNLVQLLLWTNIVNLVSPLLFVWFIPSSLKVLANAQKDSALFRVEHPRNEDVPNLPKPTPVALIPDSARPPSLMAWGVVLRGLAAYQHDAARDGVIPRCK